MGEHGTEQVTPLTPELIEALKTCQLRVEEPPADRSESEMMVMVQSESSRSWAVFISMIALITSLLCALT